MLRHTTRQVSYSFFSSSRTPASLAADPARLFDAMTMVVMVMLLVVVVAAAEFLPLHHVPTARVAHTAEGEETKHLSARAVKSEDNDTRPERATTTHRNPISFNFCTRYWVICVFNPCFHCLYCERWVLTHRPRAGFSAYLVADSFVAMRQRRVDEERKSEVIESRASSMDATCPTQNAETVTYGLRSSRAADGRQEARRTDYPTRAGPCAGPRRSRLPRGPGVCRSKSREP